MQLSIKIYTLRDTYHLVFSRMQWNKKSHPKFAHAMKTSMTYHNYHIYHKNRNRASTVHGEVPACMHMPGVGWTRYTGRLGLREGILGAQGFQ